MREIKFRALNWNEVMIYGNLITNERGKKFVVANDYFCIDGHHLSCDSDYPIWCKEETIGQYTGLKDINSVEIYEGDIVKAKTNIGYVKYNEKDCKFEVCTLDWDIDFSEYSCWEVIGNIYENPELLLEK